MKVVILADCLRSLLAYMDKHYFFDLIFKEGR